MSALLCSGLRSSPRLAFDSVARQLDAVLPNGSVIGTVVPGTVVGEMSFFRGGKRGCDMKATISGSIAVLKFSDMVGISSAASALAHKLVLAFAREACLHSVFPQATPFMKVITIGSSRGSPFLTCPTPPRSSSPYRTSPYLTLTLALPHLAHHVGEQARRLPRVLGL